MDDKSEYMPPTEPAPELKEAITRGLVRFQEYEKIKKLKAIEEHMRKLEQEKQLIERYQHSYVKNGKIFQLIEDAIARGEDKIYLSGEASLVRVLNEVPGLMAYYQEEKMIRHPDGIERPYKQVLVTWST